MKSIWLKYFIGELSLFSLPFPFLVLNIHPAELTTDLDELSVPFEEFPSTVQGALIYSHPIEEDLPRFSLLPGLVRYVPEQYERYYIDLRGTFADYLKKFSSKSRSTLRRKVRKFAEISGGEIHWCEFCRYEEMEEFYRLAREVSEKTYQERLLDMGLPTSDEFRRQMLNLASNGGVSGYVLFHSGRPISYLYCPIEDGILLYRYLGYDPDFHRSSPGTVLQYLALEKLFAERKFRMFDFTGGGGAHKEFFATGSIRCANIYYFHRTTRNLILLGLHLGFHILSRSVVRILDLLRLKTTIKTLIRRKAQL